MKEDINLAISLWGNEEVVKYISRSGKFSDREIFDRLDYEIDTEKQFSVQYWPVFGRDTGGFIGCCGLHPYNIEKHIYEIGFHLKPEYWGKGFASEAAREVMQFAFSELNAAELFSGHNPHNHSSKKVLDKLGFKYTGNEYYEPTGLYHPSYKCIKSTFIQP